MKQQIDIFLFANPKSGARLGQKFLDFEFSKVHFDLDQGIEVVMHLIDLTNPERKAKALREMREVQRKYLASKSYNPYLNSQQSN